MEDINNFISLLGKHTSDLSNIEYNYDKYLDFLTDDDFCELNNESINYNIHNITEQEIEEKDIVEEVKDPVLKKYFSFESYIINIDKFSNITRFLCIKNIVLYSFYIKADLRLRYFHDILKKKYDINLKAMAFIYYQGSYIHEEMKIMAILNLYNNDLFLNQKSIEKSYDALYVEIRISHETFTKNLNTIMYLVFNIINTNLNKEGDLVLNINFINHKLYYHFICILRSVFKQVILFNPRRLLQVRPWHMIILKHKNNDIPLTGIIPSKLNVEIESDIDDFYQKIAKYFEKLLISKIEITKLLNVFYKAKLLDKNMYEIMKYKLYSKVLPIPQNEKSI